ncbi:MAG: universal stress protein [Candidatus Dormibacteraceae bacterium]
MKVLLLVDGFHTGELLNTLARMLRLAEAHLLLMYVEGPDPRSGLELVRHRPGGDRLPAHRARELGEAELERSANVLSEAEDLARPMVSAVETRQVRGEPGRAVCDIAALERADLIAISAGRRSQPLGGHGSLGPLARFVVDHSPCPVVLLRGGPRGS